VCFDLAKPVVHLNRQARRGGGDLRGLPRPKDLAGPHPGDAGGCDALTQAGGLAAALGAERRVDVGVVERHQLSVSIPMPHQPDLGDVLDADEEVLVQPVQRFQEFGAGVGVHRLSHSAMV
jgi:hypothetical protein